MAAAEKPLQALLQAALALPILLVPAKSGAAEVSEVGFTLLGYKERGLMKVTEPIAWIRGKPAEDWEVTVSGLIDIVSGASPAGVTNASGRPVQVVTGASVADRRRQGDLKVSHRMGDLTVGVSGAWSTEEDYFSRAFGAEARLDLNQKNTTLAAGIARSADRVGSSEDPTLHEPRTTREYLFGVTQVLSRTAAIQSTVTRAMGSGWYNDPYRYTITFYPPELGLAPAFYGDTRPPRRDSWSWLNRYRRHMPDARGTLHVDYRYYRDSWDIVAHTLEVAWQQELGERWALRPGLRYSTQQAARFYSPAIPVTVPNELSSDQRLGAFGSLSPSLKAVLRFDNGLAIEGTAGYVRSAANLRLGGSGSEAYATMRAVYGLVTVSRAF